MSWRADCPGRSLGAKRTFYEGINLMTIISVPVILDNNVGMVFENRDDFLGCWNRFTLDHTSVSLIVHLL